MLNFGLRSVLFIFFGVWLQVSSLQKRLTSLQETMLNFGLRSVLFYFLWCGFQVSSLQEQLTSLQETMLNFGLRSVLFIFFGVVSGVLAAGAADQ